MEKINKAIERKFANDCWCSSISKSTGLSYDKVYKDFKPFLEDNDGASLLVITRYLCNKNYEAIKVDLDLETALQLYNSETNNKTIFSLVHKDDKEWGHMIYIENKVIYDEINNVDYANYLSQWKLDRVFFHLGGKL